MCILRKIKTIVITCISAFLTVISQCHNKAIIWFLSSTRSLNTDMDNYYSGIYKKPHPIDDLDVLTQTGDHFIVGYIAYE